MKTLVVVSFMTFIALLAGCSSTEKAPSVLNNNVLKSSENERIYAIAYDTVFRAAVESLREIDNASAKLVKYNEGIIVFKKPNNTGTVTAYVRRIDDRTTRVELIAKVARRFLPDSTDTEARDAFFSVLDRTLSFPAEAASQKDQGSALQMEQEKPGDEVEKKKADLVTNIGSQLKLEESQKFLEKLTYEELATLEQRLQSLKFSAEEKDRLSRRCASCYIDLSRIYHDSQQYVRAAEALKVAISIDPDSAVAHCNLGEIYKHLQLYDDAIRELDEARRLDPHLPDTYINLGIIYDDYVVDDGKALEYYKKYIDLGGTDEQVHGWIRAIEEMSPS